MIVKSDRKYGGGVLRYYNPTTDETLRAMAPVSFREDFDGKALDTTNRWTLHDTGAATEALKADAGGGILELALTSANEAQLAGITFGDQRTILLSKDPVFEAVFALSVLPTGSVVACIGICGDHNAAIASVAQKAWFKVTAGGVIVIDTADGTNTNSDVATGVTLSAGEKAYVRIDCSDPTSVKFYINDARKAGGTTFNLNATPSQVFQPVVRIGKEAAATTVGTLELDMIQYFAQR